MNIFEFQFENWYTFCARFNWLALIITIIIIGFILYIIKKSTKKLGYRYIDVDAVTLGIGKNNIKLKYNKKDQEIAYKLWVELNTRKIGLPFDEKNDVIVEVYNSWYEFFKIARELLKDIPPSRLHYSAKLITVTTDVLNVGLRPHLTKWQAKYRKWYKSHAKDDGDPQEIQRKFPEYDDLINDLKQTNTQMIEYKNLMYKIAFDNQK